MKKLSNYHHKTSSDYISKQKIKNQMKSSAVIFKSNVMKIKINSISNSKDGYIFLPNTKISNGRSFDKELQDNKKIMKNYLKKKKFKKDSEKNSLEIESKDEISTNYLTESLQFFTELNLNNINNKVHLGNIANSTNNNCNYNNYINNNINKKLSTINARNNMNSNYIPTISINIKKKDNENRLKANIDVKTKTQNNKCLNINNNKIIKKNKNISNSKINENKINETFNKVPTKNSFENKIFKKNYNNSYNKEQKINMQNRDICQAKRKLSNLVEDNMNKALFPAKCKTQNYLSKINNSNNNNSNNNNINNNCYSNRKMSINNSYENKNINYIINSKKKLFIKNNKKENKDNKDNKKSKDVKEMSNKIKNKTKKKLKNIKLKQKNVLLLKSISVAQKLMRTNSPVNPKTISLNATNYYDNNHTINQESTYKDFYLMQNNTDRKKEDNNSNKNLLNNIKKNKIIKKNSYSKKDNNNNQLSTTQKHSLIKKTNEIKQKNLEKNKINNTNIILTKKKKNSHNNVVNINSSNKKIKIETSFDEKNIIKNKNSKNINNSNNKKQNSFQQKINNSNVNKVLIFEIGNNKMITNKNNNINDKNLNNSKNSNNHSYKNILHRENSKTNKKIIYNQEITPKKNILTDIIKKNIEYNKDNKSLIKDIKSMSNNISGSFFGENTSTPLDHKHAFIKNKTFIDNNNEQTINKSDNEINKDIDDKKNTINQNNINNNDIIIDKDFSNMDTPILLNTPKLTGRIIDAKLNLFEKVRNITNGNENSERKNIIKSYKKSKEDNFNEIEEIIKQELSKSSNINSLNNTNIKNKNIQNQNKIINKKKIINTLENILFLNKEYITTIFNYFDLQMINTFTLINKKYYNRFKFIINEKIKNKILEFYKEKTKIYNNNIKLSLMQKSSLSKISPILLHKKYIDLLLENNNKYDKEIQKDLTRTFPDNISFKYGNNNYNKLYHLLTVYSLYNQNIGYAQGINFLAAHTILLFEKEEEGFIFFDALLQRFEFEKLLGVENELHNKLYNIGLYLKKFCPEISSYLERMNLSHEFFTTNWMITLFSNSMEERYLFIVWDFLIIYGWKFFRYFVVSILNIYKNNILEEEQNNLTFFMKNILKNEQFKVKFKDIINNSFILMNEDNIINKY